GSDGEYLVLSGTPGADRSLTDRSLSNSPTDTAFSRTHVASLQSEAPVGTRRAGLLQGFNAALSQSFETSGGAVRTLLRGKDPASTRIGLSPGVNGAEGTFRSARVEGSDGTSTLAVGVGGANGPSAYVGDRQYAAVATTGGVTATTARGSLTPAGDVGSYMVSGRVAEVSGFALCSACDFIEWGCWGTRADGAVALGDGATAQ
ncbi:hypothetical protein, partial [Aureimonas pseudogalii]|uniref:hypothetical protein n=1 Tax=Aureimonas pseudogalii TaxID=1744844 RepID=UPI0035EDC9BE